MAPAVLQCLVGLFFLAKLSVCQNYQLAPLAVTTNAVTLACQDSTGVAQDIDNVQFWLNRTRMDSGDLRERKNIPIFEDQTDNEISISFSRNIEGYYTCGTRIDSVNFDESPPLTLVGK